MSDNAQFGAPWLALAFAISVAWSPIEAKAVGSGELLKDFLDISASVGRDTVQNDRKFDEAAFDAVVDSIIGKISQSIVQSIVKSGFVVTEKQFKSAVKWHMKTNLTRIKDINRAKAGTIGTDILVGFAIDAAADAVNETVGGVWGEAASYGIKQAKVAYAGAKYGIHAAIMEQTVISGTQLKKAVELSIELNKLKNDNDVKQAINAANQNAALYRKQYLVASTASEKKHIENQIATVMGDALISPKFWGGETDVPGGQALVDRYIANLKAADRSKFTVIQQLTDQISQNPQAAMAYRDLAYDFLRDNFSARSDFFRKQSTAVTQAFEITARASTTELRRLVEKSRSLGGTKNLSSAELTRMSELARGLDPSLNVYDKDEIVRRVFVQIVEFEAEFGINRSETLPPAMNFEPLSRWAPPVAEATPPETSESENGKTPLIGDANGSDRSDEVKTILGERAQTDIPFEQVDATPEEIAEQQERLAELRRQEIARLELERTAQFEVKFAREVQIQNIDSELALLKFGDRQEVQNALSLVTGEEQRLRAELNDTGLNVADQQLLQDLLVYQETLEYELDRISDKISSLESERNTLQSELDNANTVIIANSDQLNTFDYDYSQFTEPTTSEELMDFSDYEYELPVFNSTELLTSNLANVVGHAVSVPIVGGNYRVNIDLVAEDNTILDLGIPGAITEIEDDNSDLLDGFTHLYFGNGVDENGDDSQWIYGEAATPEQFALRTGTATFNGGLSGYYAHGSVSDHTLYQDGVSGSLALEVDFGTNRLTGAGEIEIDTAVRNEALAFSLNESTISETDSGFTRSLDFSANATLENERGVSGNLGGTFYGEDASEAAGSFAFDLGTGFSAGLWAAGENFEGFTEDNYDGSFAIAYASVNNGTSTFSGDTPERQNGRIRISREQDGTPILSDVTDTFSSDGYENVTWGSLRLDFSPTNAEIFNYSGNWVDVDGITSSTDLQDRSGSAQFGGEILGGYVASGGIEENALGIINLTANFGTQVVSGQFQFGHSCSGSGLNGCASASEIQSFNEVINDYNGSGFGNHGNRGLSGVIGVFGGDSAHEIGGYAWLTDVGSYVGVFRAREDLSFSEFVTPTTTGTHDPSDPPGTNYSNYRGLAAYNGYNFVSQDYVVGFVSVETVDPGYATPVLFENTFEGGDLTNSADSIGRDYSYMNWGSWENADNTITEVDGQGLRGSDANWIVYDPTTNLRTTGQATYNGDAVGLTSASAGLSGNIQLTADFANDTVTGNMSLETSNGQSWADASFDTTIRRNTDSSGFQGALTGSDVNSGVIFGGFAGPDAEEVGGGWQIDNANGTNGVGIFRAQN